MKIQYALPWGLLMREKELTPVHLNSFESLRPPDDREYVVRPRLIHYRQASSFLLCTT